MKKKNHVEKRKFAMECTYDKTRLDTFCPVICEFHSGYGSRTGDVAVELETFTFK